MWGLMEALLAKYPEDEIHEGDLFVANDPFVAGGTHLPDVNLAMPVFADGELMAFVCNIAHHADIGGMAPGSMAGGMSEIFQEGLRIPVLKLFRRGELQQDLLDLLLLNVRVPEERRGDYFAQIAASRLGVRRLAEVIASHGRAVVAAGFEQIIARTERRMRDAIRADPRRHLSLRGRHGRRRHGGVRHPDRGRGDGRAASASPSTSPAPRPRSRAASTSRSMRPSPRSAMR